MTQFAQVAFWWVNLFAFRWSNYLLDLFAVIYSARSRRFKYKYLGGPTLKYLLPIMSVFGTRNFADQLWLFLGPDTDIFCQFLVPEIIKMGQHFQEFWPIEKEKTSWTCFRLCMSSIETKKIHSNKNWLILKFLDLETDIMVQFLRSECVSFWPQKLTLWARDTISGRQSGFTSGENWALILLDFP
jgi:hypothetical protein